MLVDWKKFDYELFQKTLPHITRLYFGQKLEPSEYKKRKFTLVHAGMGWLAVAHRPYRIGSREIFEIASEIMQKEASAGLIVSRSTQPFALRLFKRSPGCWFPIAIWGRKHVDSIASMNSDRLANFVPYKRYGSSRGGSLKLRSLGKGGVLWSDIVEFVQLSVNIGNKIGLNPARVRWNTIMRVDGCFRRAGGLSATHWQMVGGDGWFHFYKTPHGSKTIKLAMKSMINVRNVAATHPDYTHHILKVAMGINDAKNVQVSPGGPFDDGSIITYYLLDKKFRKYDLRATEGAISNLVRKANRPQWSNYNVLSYFGKNIKIYGR